MIYYHKHEDRWSDIDANRHLNNSSYVQYCAQTRILWQTQNRCSTQRCVFCTKIFVFKGSLHDKVIVFARNFWKFWRRKYLSIYAQILFTRRYTLCNCRSNGVWIDMMLRKTTTPPDDIFWYKWMILKLKKQNYYPEKTLKALPFPSGKYRCEFNWFKSLNFSKNLMRLKMILKTFYYALNNYVRR